jgi:hypothetical protein
MDPAIHRRRIQELVVPWPRGCPAWGAFRHQLSLTLRNRASIWLYLHPTAYIIHYCQGLFALFPLSMASPSVATG